MNTFKKILAAIIVCLALIPAATPALVMADTQSQIQSGVNEAAGGAQSQTPGQTLDSTVKTVINVLSLIAGAAAVVMIIIGGFRYVTSAGSPEATKGAKNTILYALVGLVVVAVAQVIVHFVLKNVTDAVK